MFTSVSKVPQIGYFSAKPLHVAMFARSAPHLAREDRSYALRARAQGAPAGGSGFDQRESRRGKAAPWAKANRRLTARQQRGFAALLTHGDRSNPPS